MSGEGPHEIDRTLTIQHHNYYGEEADPELARMLAANRNRASSERIPQNNNNSDSESVDLTVDATEVRNTGIATRSTLPVIPEKNIEIVNDESIVTRNGESIAEESIKDRRSDAVQTPLSIRISRRKNDICSPMSTSH